MSISRLNRKVKKLFSSGEKEAIEKLQEMNLSTSDASSEKKALEKLQELNLSDV